MRLLNTMYFFIWLNHGTMARICNTVYIIISFSQPRLKWKTGNQREVKTRAVFLLTALDRTTDFQI